MEIYLIRHTTPNIQKGICYGQSDLDVTDTFNNEVSKIHSQIPIQKISKIYCSPLQRCKLLAKTFNISTIFDERLKELDFGDWELKPWDAIDSSQIDPWMKDFVNIQVPNGESYVMLQERMLHFYNSLNHSGEENILIITHAGPIRALLSHLRRIDLKNSFDIKVSYGEVIKI